MKLVIGNRNYSSWSLRAWLYLRQSGIEFEEIRVPMFTDDWADRIGAYSPARRVPVLLDGEITVWDSLAIVQHLLETRDDALGWPADPLARGAARSVVAEMHSGFLALRDELPQNIRARRHLPLESLSDTARSQVGRVMEIVDGSMARFASGGRWLFGELSVADIFYAPVALRFVTYDIPLTAAVHGFVEAVRSLDAVRAWERGAAAESESLPFVDDLVPAAQSPLVLG